MFKKSISLLLAVILTAGVILSAPLSASASETATPDEVVQSSLSPELGEITVAGSATTGAMLTDALQQAQLDGEGEGDYANAITGVDYDYKQRTATVSLSVRQQCRVIVGLYDEAGEVLLYSAKSDLIEPFAESTTVGFTSNISQKFRFYLRAFLVDEDNDPLCKPYETDHFTEAFMDYYGYTVGSFNQNRVFNLDDDNETNFVVLRDDVMKIGPGKYNNLISSEDGVYVFDNIDSNLRSLTAGSRLAYTDDDGALETIVVDSIQIYNTMAVVTATKDAELEDVFSYVKIEFDGDISDAELDESYADEGVAIADDDSDLAETGFEGHASAAFSRTFSLDVNGEVDDPAAPKPVDGELSVKGSLTLSLSVALSIYISEDIFEIDLTMPVNLSVNMRASAVGTLRLALPKLAFTNGVIGVGATLALVLEAEAYVEGTAGVSFVVGFGYNNAAGFRNRSSSPDARAEVKIGGRLFLGLEVTPDIEALAGSVQLGTVTRGGFELEMSRTFATDDDPDLEHSCTLCFDGDITFKITHDAMVRFHVCNYDGVMSTRLCDVTVDLGKCYYSSELGFGWGVCPNRGYRLTVQVLDRDGAPIHSAFVNGHSVDYSGKVNLLIKGSIAVTAAANGYLPATVNVSSVKLGSLTITLYKPTEGIREPDQKTTGNSSASDPEARTNVSLNKSSGVMTVYGNGGTVGTYMLRYKEDRSFVRTMNVREGITTVSSSAGSYYYGDSYENLETIYFPNSLTQIGNNAFYGSSRLQNVYFGNRLEYIGRYAFDGTHLKNVTLPDSILRVDGLANSHIENFSIPCSITYYGAAMEKDNRYKDDGGLWEFSGENYCSIDHLIIRDGGYLTGPERHEVGTEISMFFSRRPRSGITVKDITVGEGIVSLHDFAFYRINGLESVTLPSTLTKIGRYAFEDCSSLQSVNIPENVTEIGSSAFEDCSSLQSVTIPDGVTKISDKTFYGCTALQSVTIPDGVTEIGYDSFRDCTSLQSITIPASVTRIDDDAFFGCTSLQSVTILSDDEHRDNDVVIGKYAFYGCTALQNLALGDNVTRIGIRAFYNCAKLKNTQFPDRLAEIGGGAFYGCTTLRKVELGEGLRMLGYYGYYSYGYENPRYNAEGVFEGCDGLRHVTLSEGVRFIGSRAFYGCPIEEIQIPASVRILGDDAFGDTYYLEDLWELSPEGIVYDQDIAFGVKGECPAEPQVKKGTRLIAGGCFKGCAITGITIPGSVLGIGDRAFMDCASLKSLELPDSVLGVGAQVINGSGITSLTLPMMTEIFPFAFCENNTLAEISLTEGITKIGEYAFYKCTSLTTVNLPSSLTEIGEHAFSYCTSLPSDIVIPGGVKEIEQFAFYRCESLKNLTIMNGVTEIGGCAFEYCSALTTLELPVSVTKVGVYAFADCDSLKRVTLRNRSVALGESAFGYCDALTSVTPDIYRHHEAFKNTPYYQEENDTAATGAAAPADTGADTGDTAPADTGAAAPADTGDTEPSSTEDISELTNGSEYIRQGLVPGEEYLLVITPEGDEGALLDPIYLAQSTADDNGTVRFTIYGNRNFNYFYEETGIEVYVLGACVHKSTHTSTALDPETGMPTVTVTICDNCHKTIATAEADILLGDADGDGTVSVSDVSIIQRRKALMNTRYYVSAAADIDGDGEVTIVDATLLQRWLAQLPAPDGINQPIKKSS